MKHREHIYGIDSSMKKVLINFGQWGGGELRFIPRAPLNEFHSIFIPYLTFRTLEKVIVYAKHAPVRQVTVGYCSYSRADKANPELHEQPMDKMLLEMLRQQLPAQARIHVIDIHNQKSVEGIEDCFVFNPQALLLNELKHLSDYNLVAPDAGCASRSGYEFDYICDKKRNSDGSMTNTIHKTPKRAIDSNTFVILDDICDGGRTFIKTAQLIRRTLSSDATVLLLVSHAILPFGTDELFREIDGIITLNTCQEEDSSKIRVVDCHSLLLP
ncbi:MAG: hypothetical protein ACRCZZ_08900 [Phocaeicola sp.]